MLRAIKPAEFVTGLMHCIPHLLTSAPSVYCKEYLSYDSTGIPFFCVVQRVFSSFFFAVVLRLLLFLASFLSA